MSLRKFLHKLWLGIRHIFEGIEHELRILVPVAIKVVEGIKAAMDGPVDDVLASIIKHAIPGDADDKFIDKVTSTINSWIPKVLLELNMVDAIANIEDTNEQLQAILDKLKLSSDETKNIFYHGLSSLILEKLSDGKFSWSDAVAVAEYYYQHEFKQE
jgi:hypothetical protein